MNIFQEAMKLPTEERKIFFEWVNKYNREFEQKLKQKTERKQNAKRR